MSAFSPMKVHWAILTAAVPGTIKAVLHALAVRADKTGTSWPGHALLARDTGLSQGTVRRALATAKNLGVLDVQTGKQHQSNRYAFRLSTLITLSPSQTDQSDHPGEVQSDHGDHSETVQGDQIDTSRVIKPVSQGDQGDQRSDLRDQIHRSGTTSVVAPAPTVQESLKLVAAVERLFGPLPTTSSPTTKRAAQKRATKKEPDAKPPPEVFQLRDHYIAAFRLAKGCDPKFDDGEWKGALKAFKALIAKEGSLTAAKLIVDSAFADEYRVRTSGLTEPWHLKRDANRLRPSKDAFHEDGDPRAEGAPIEGPAVPCPAHLLARFNVLTETLGLAWPPDEPEPSAAGGNTP